jgi:glyoxylase-like metal-dependent hydrolase (beta-lactamase superfamily II)
VGKLVAHLKAAGYQPEQVDAVLITHLHPDHVGGLTADGKMVFPNAAVYAGKEDIDYFLSQANLDQAAEDKKMSFKDAQAALAPYVKAGQLKPLTDDTGIVPGIRSRASHGHTPGHTSYVVESKGQKLVLLGDIVHVAAVQFADPSVRLQFDSDSKRAQEQREAAFADAAAQGYWIGAAHLPFPGIGHVRADKKGFDFVPANYTR